MSQLNDAAPASGPKGNAGAQAGGVLGPREKRAPEKRKNLRQELPSCTHCGEENIPKQRAHLHVKSQGFDFPRCVSKKTPKPKPVKGRSGPPVGRTHSVTVQQLARQVENYHCTEAYTKAVNKGFKTIGAIDKFNEFVHENKDKIDPSAITVCGECGQADIYICKCQIPTESHTVELDEIDLDEGVVFVVRSQPWAHTRFVRSAITSVKNWWEPKFDANRINNPSAGYAVEQTNHILDVDMFNYMKAEASTSYLIDGKYDRQAKLAHMKKLGKQYWDKVKMPLSERITSARTNQLIATAARATDEIDTEMLQQELNPMGGGYFWAKMLGFGQLVTRVITILLLSIFLLWSIGALPSATLFHWLLHNLETLSWGTSLLGSMEVFVSLVAMILNQFA